VNTLTFCEGVFMMPRTRPPYAPEFHRQMVELVRAGLVSRIRRKSLNPLSSPLVTGFARPTSMRDGAMTDRGPIIVKSDEGFIVKTASLSSVDLKFL
jgi:hypothetical protein